MTRAAYSVVIASDRIDKQLRSVEALGRLGAKDRPLEVLVSVGRNPSQQRNLGVEKSRGPLVYFLDDDSEVIPGTPGILAAHFEEGRTAVAGGPNLCPPQATPFENTVSAVLASWMGSFSVRNRYAAIGAAKEATEKDLILCNMMVRRRTFLKEGGFRKDLYPNEENEFLNRLLHSQYRLVYDPAGAVFRHRRKNLRDFCYQSFRYGRGRAQQMKVYPCLSDLVHLVPAFFLFYVISLLAPLAPFLPPWAAVILDSLYWRVPIFFFLLLAFGTAVSALSWHRNPLDLLGVPLLIFLRQCFYGIGLLAGLLKPIPHRESGPIRLYKAVFKGAKLRFTEVTLRRHP
jgi:succinoglycan biosynthesis protein ExoA